jgi:DNA-binding PadR family transcriptional regulator
MQKEFDELGRFSDPSLLILSSLASGAKHGYAMIQDIEAFSAVRLEPGTLYGALARLEQRGWIEPLPAEDRRRPYRLSAVGAEVLRSQLESMQRVVRVGLKRLPAGTTRPAKLAGVTSPSVDFAAGIAAQA